MLTDAEKQLANVFFTYSWNKGRLRLFGNMAKALVPGTMPSTAEKAVMQQAVARWTAVNLVMPHIWRIAVSKVPTAGMFGSRIPIGQQVDPATGRSRPLYADPSGYYADAMQFLDHPISYAFARTNPILRTTFDTLRAIYEQHQIGGSELEAIGPTIARDIALSAPAGVPQALTPGRPLAARALPFFGVPVYTTPPRPEDPAIALHEALMHQNYADAAQIIRTHQMGLTRILALLNPDERRQVEHWYRYFAPRTSGGGGSMGVSLGLPSELR
jgi:hypothetical protein